MVLGGAFRLSRSDAYLVAVLFVVKMFKHKCQKVQNYARFLSLYSVCYKNVVVIQKFSVIRNSSSGVQCIT